MDIDLIVNLLVRIASLSFGTWILLLGLRRLSGSLRSAIARCCLAACVATPLLMPLAKVPSSGDKESLKVGVGLAPAQVATALKPEDERIFPSGDSSAAGAAESFMINALFGVAGLLIMFVVADIARAAKIAWRSEKMFVLGCPVRISDQRVPPMTVLWRSVVLPSELLSWPDSQLRLVLEHEMAHARRLDAMTITLSSIVRSLFWPVPFVWLVHRELILAIEDAADDEVIAKERNPLTYAETLCRACETFRFAPPVTPNFARKPMIFFRIARTLEPNTDRRKIRPIQVFALLIVFGGVATAGAYGLLTESSLIPTQSAETTSQATVEVVQLQTFGSNPRYWTPDGTPIEARNAITRAPSTPNAKEGDVIVWLRVETQQPDAMLWMPSVETGPNQILSTNSGASFRQEGWLYSASRIAPGKKALPQKATLNASAHVAQWTQLPSCLTDQMIFRGEGKGRPVLLKSPYVSVEWGRGRHAFRQFDSSKKLVPGPERDATFIDLAIERNTSYSDFSLRVEYKNPEVRPLSDVISSSPDPRGPNHYRLWVDDQPDTVKSVGMEVRKASNLQIRNVALRPKE